MGCDSALASLTSRIAHGRKSDGYDDGRILKYCDATHCARGLKYFTTFPSIRSPIFPVEKSPRNIGYYWILEDGTSWMGRRSRKAYGRVIYFWGETIYLFVQHVPVLSRFSWSLALSCLNNGFWGLTRFIVGPMASANSRVVSAAVVTTTPNYFVFIPPPPEGCCRNYRQRSSHSR